MKLKVIKNKLFFVWITLLLVCNGIPVLSQTTEMIEFPDDFFGIYTGSLQIVSEQGDQITPMEFHLLASDSIGRYAYTLVYGAGKTKLVRDYSLVEMDKENGLYVVNENNGILLDSKVIRNSMYTLFEVNDTLLTTFITFEKDYMVFEITATPKSGKRVTYTEDENKTEVISYPITTIQRAVLKKQ